MNEIDAFREYHPEAATKLSEEFMKRLSDPNFNKNIPQREKELMGAIIGVEVVNPVVSGVMLANYSKEDEEEKPGPKPQAQWVEGRFPGTQLAGSYAVEQRRNT
jgi:quinol-cytochrome oxidoreductase complex cytochrome b subunit